MKICIIPIDNRPVCYNLLKDIAQIDESIELFLPERKFLGDLKKIANIENILSWLENLPKMDKIILSLDTIAYGGLIPSRRSIEAFENIKLRIEKLKKILKNKNAEIHAFSSIMRISNNNINQEEKEYWNIWGEKIFEYSYNFHKNKKSETEIPQEILTDYINTRKRNFEINKIYLDWQKEGLLKTLIFSKDDCAEFGLNVKEGQELETLGGFTKTGADEIPMTLFARAIDKKIKVAPIFIENAYKHLISNYEDISIEESVKSQLELGGFEITNEENADIILIVNNFIDNQGEIVMKKTTQEFSQTFTAPNKPYMVADVRFANGADNVFVKQLLKKIDDNFYGYSAWNTSANTLGSLLCASKIKFEAEKYSEKAFKKLQLIRFLDDWAYQANIRQIITEPLISNEMSDFEEKLKQVFDCNFETKYSFPWNRLFELEVKIEFI